MTRAAGITLLTLSIFGVLGSAPHTPPGAQFARHPVQVSATETTNRKAV
jgi:hypothetical protein